MDRWRTSLLHGVCALLVVLAELSGSGVAAAGTISGLVTAPGGTPLAGVNVQALTPAGRFVAGAVTDATGAYSITAPDGVFYVRTFNTAHYVNQLYHASGNLLCLGNCTLAAGTAVDLSNGASASGIAFALEVGGAIAGTLTGEGGAALPNVRIEIRNRSNVYVDNVTTNSSGAYLTLNGLPSGEYFVVSDDNRLGYINEIYPDAPCLLLFNCPVISGTQVVVTAGATVSGIGIALSKGATFAGAVTAASTGEPIGNVQIDVLNSAGLWYAQAFTTVAGNFATGRGMPPGTYYLRTRNDSGYINRFHDGSVCLANCPLTAIAPILITDASASTVDFALDLGGRIAGTIRDAQSGAALANVDVQFFATTGSQLTIASTDAAGAYVSRDGLPPGLYHVRTTAFSAFSQPGYLHELYPDRPCVGACAVTLGDTVSVSAGHVTTGIDFALSRGARLSGEIVEAGASAIKISNASVQILNAAGTLITSATSDALGRWATFVGLPAGSYYIRTFSFAGHIPEVYPDAPCLGFVCPSGVGSPVAVASAGAVMVDVDLVLAARAGGKVVDQTTGAAIVGASVSIIDASGQSLSSGFTDPLGNYLTGIGLPDGTYYARSSNGLGYINELHRTTPPEVACHFGCRVTDGSPIALAGTNVRPGVDFHLQLGGQAAGKVVDALTGLALANVQVTLFDPTANIAVGAVSNDAGEFRAIGLPDGTYYARTSNQLGFLNEAFDDLLCGASCSSTMLGRPLVISGASVITGVDFGLQPGGRVSGTVTDSSGFPVAGVSVSLLSADGLFAAGGVTDLSGNYVTGAGLLAGRYYARTSNGIGYVNELYDDIVCPSNCTFAAGTAVQVSAGSVTAGVDFSLHRGGRVAGRITDATGTSLQFVTVSIVDASGQAMGFASSDAGGNYIIGTGLPPGTYYARTTNGQGYIDELYGGKPCPVGCSVLGGAPITVSDGQTTSGIDFSLARGGRIAGVVTDAATGQPVSGVSVQIYDSSGALFTTGFTNIFGSYVSSAGLPSIFATAGTYYVRTTNSRGYINQLYLNSTCVGTCAVTQGTAIKIVDTSTVQGIDFALGRGGKVAGRVTDLSGTGLGNVAISVTDAAGKSMSSAVTNAVGDYVTLQGLLAGSYFVRTVNEQGYVNQVYGEPNGFECLGACDVSIGTPVAVTLGQTTNAIDFGLPHGARLRGSVRTSDGNPAAGVAVSVRNAANVELTAGTTDGTGTYVTAAGVPSGTYYAVTQNTFGLLNQVYEGIDCDVSCAPTNGTPIAMTAPAIVGGVDFVLQSDTDSDDDGIGTSIDVAPQTYSHEFSDVPHGGSTDGVIVGRGGWVVKAIDLSPGGIQLQALGGGTSAAAIDVCPAGGAQRVIVNAAGEAVSVLCPPGTTSAFVRALVASPTVDVRHPAIGSGTLTRLTTNQAVTVGSPVTASADNTQAIMVDIVDAADRGLGRFALDPNESADVTVESTGISVTVIVGVIAVEVNGVSTSLQPGETLTLPTAQPDVNGDGVVNCGDLSFVRASIRRSDRAPADTRADVNGDGVVTDEDADLVRQALRPGSRCP